MYFSEHQGADLLNEVLTMRSVYNEGIGAEPLQFLLEACKHRQVIIAKAKNDEPLASLAYARVSKYTLRVINQNLQHRLAANEYDEGQIVFIKDAFIRKGTLKNVIQLLMPHLLGFRLIAYIHRDRLFVVYNDKGSLRLVRSAVLQSELVKLGD